MADLISLMEDRLLRAITDQLRVDGWTPRRTYLCGCVPTDLCRAHAIDRAAEHYGEMAGWRRK